MRANHLAVALAFSGLLPGCPTSSSTATPPLRRPRNSGQPEFDWSAQGTPAAAERNVGFVDQPTTLAAVARRRQRLDLPRVHLHGSVAVHVTAVHVTTERGASPA